MGVGMGQLIVILLIILLLFGAGRIPRVMGDIGKGIRALRDSLNEDDKTKK